MKLAASSIVPSSLGGEVRRQQRGERLCHRVGRESRRLNLAAEHGAALAGHAFEVAADGRAERAQLEVAQRGAAGVEARIEARVERERAERADVDGRRHGAAQQRLQRARSA